MVIIHFVYVFLLFKHEKKKERGKRAVARMQRLAKSTQPRISLSKRKAVLGTNV